MLDKKRFFSSVFLAALIFTGCSSSPEQVSSNSDDTERVSVRGSSSLAKATVCIDLNRDNSCQESEASTTSAEDGSYELTYVEEGTHEAYLVAEGGFNLITLQENSSNMVLLGSLDENASHNINTFTTLIEEAVQNNMSYSEAKRYVASSFNLDETYIDEDPLTLLEETQTQDYFLTLRSIEDQQVQESDSIDEYIQAFQNRAPLRSVELNSSVITMDEAVEAVNDSDIYDFDLEGYLQRLSDLFADFFHNLLSYFGFDWGDQYHFDADTLDPYILKIYTGEINASSSGTETEREHWAFVQSMSTGDEENISKNYKDLEYIFSHTTSDETMLVIGAVYAGIGTETSVSKFLDIIDRSYVIPKLPRMAVDIGIWMATSKIVDGVATDEYYYDHAHLYEEYFQTSTNEKYKDIIGRAIVRLSQKEEISTVLDYMKAHYVSSEVSYVRDEDMPANYSAENRNAENLSNHFIFYDRNTSSQALVDFYDRSEDENLKRKLRIAYAGIANEITVEKLYALASKLPPLTQPFDSVQSPRAMYLSLFEEVKRQNSDIGAFVASLRRKYPFENVSLETDIRRIFGYANFRPND